VVVVRRLRFLCASWVCVNKKEKELSSVLWRKNKREKNRYTDITGSAACIECTYGKAQSATGSSSCVNCAGGTYEDAKGASACSGICAAGRFSTGGARNCTLCPGGEKQSSMGKSSCDSCPVGQLSSADRTNCYSCDAGTYVENSEVLNSLWQSFVVFFAPPSYQE